VLHLLKLLLFSNHQVVPDSHFMFGCGGSFFNRCQDGSDIIDVVNFDDVAQMQAEKETGE
jgi:hypothetical protein